MKKTVSKKTAAGKITVELSAKDTRRLRAMAALFGVDAHTLGAQVIDEVLEAYEDIDSGFVRNRFNCMTFTSLREFEDVLDRVKALEVSDRYTVEAATVAKKVSEGWQVDIEGTDANRRKAVLEHAKSLT